MIDVRNWLLENGFERFADLFEENEIDGEVLFDLTDGDLKDLGLALGPRKKLLKALADNEAGDGLQSTATPESRPARAPAGHSPVAQDAERRHLTVMFVDLVGSTALAGRIDPEDMRDVIIGFQNAVAGVVTRFEGQVAKYMGDGVLCYFGWPKAHEDDAERAVRAGLAIVQALARLQTPDGDVLTARVGVATGLVVVGDLIGEGAAQEEAVVGETPNLAARLQALAEPDQVVVAEATRKLLGGMFDLIDLGNHALKGISGKTPAYIVTAERAVESRFEARVSGSVSAMVGRDHELALMLERWKSAKAGEGQLLFLTGEAGIGKSRITRAMIDAVAGEPHIRLSYQCSPYHTESSLYPAIQQLIYAADIKAGDSNDEKLDKLDAVLLDGNKALIASLLGLETEQRYGSLNLTPQQQRARTLQELVGQLIGLAMDKPVLFVLEDAHWIDASTLEFLDLCLERIASERVLMQVTARPTFEHGFGGHPIVTKLALNRLGQEQVVTIVDKITGGKTLPGELLDEIAAKTDGVPLFVEELTKTVLESGKLRETGTAFELTGPLSRLAIPATLHDSLMARLDRLQPVKEVAQFAACIGRNFDYPLIERISPLDEALLQDALAQLIAPPIFSSMRWFATPLMKAC
jgi:class 3 adenylate cyclase